MAGARCEVGTGVCVRFRTPLDAGIEDLPSVDLGVPDLRAADLASPDLRTTD